MTFFLSFLDIGHFQTFFSGHQYESLKTFLKTETETEMSHTAHKIAHRRQIQQGYVESSIERRYCSHYVQLHCQTFEFHIPPK